MSGEELVKEARVISAVRNYENRSTRMNGKTVDFTVSPSESDDKILIRVIMEGTSKAGYVTFDTAKEMSDTLQEQDYDKGILIAKRLTKAARREMEREGIEVISDGIKPRFKLERLYSVINGCIENLCRTKCGLVPEKASDCKGCIDDHYSCDVRLVSDNASFHFELGWVNFLERDLAKLLTIEKALDV